MDTIDMERELREYLDEADLTDEEFVTLFNSAVDSIGDPDDKIYFMYEFDSVIGGYFNYSPSQIVDFTSSTFTLRDRFFIVDETHEEISSFDELSDPASPFDLNTIVEGVIDTGESFGDPEIQDILDRY